MYRVVLVLPSSKLGNTFRLSWGGRGRFIQVHAVVLTSRVSRAPHSSIARGAANRVAVREEGTQQRVLWRGEGEPY